MFSCRPNNFYRLNVHIFDDFIVILKLENAKGDIYKNLEMERNIVCQ